MSLALHQLRHEFRRSRVFVAVYLVILLGNYAVAAGWIGQPEYNPDYQGWGNQGMLPGLISIAFWISIALLIMGTITADSPANRERFLASRPFPIRSLVIAKALFITLALLLPAAVVELLSLLAINAPGKIIVLGTIEHFLLLAIFASFIALFAAHWKSAFTAKLGLAVTIGIASAVIGGLAALLDVLTRHSANGRIRIPEPTMLTAALSTVVICLGLAVTLRLHTRRQWTVRHLILPFAGLSLLWFALATWLPLRSFSLPSPEQEAVAQVFDAKSDAITFTSGRVHYNQHNHQVSAGYNLIPNAPTHPDHWEIRWDANRTTWLRGGETIHRAPARRRHPTGSVIAADSPPASPAFLNILREHAPGFKFLVTTRAHDAQPRTTLEAGQFSYPHGETPPAPLTIESAITASAARWTLAANLPFATGKGVNSGNWHLAGVDPRPGDLQAYLVLHTPKLHTFRNPSQPANRWGWAGNVLFALHVPERKMVWIAGTNHARWVPTLSSAAHTFSEIRFANHSSNTDLTASELRSARLLIFQAEHLGEVTKTFRSPEFTLEPRPDSQKTVLAAVRRPHRPESTPGAFAQWLNQHKNLPTDLPADQLRDHLDELFNLERRSNAYTNYPHSPAVNHLARFVPHHRDLFLESIRGMTSETSGAQLILCALTQAATDDDKPAIITALTETPILIETVNNRGWTAAARPSIIQALEATPYRQNHLSALVSLDDPDLDEVLLTTYEASPSVSSYEILLTVPRLREKLNAITTGCWSPGLFIMGDNLVDRPLELALTQGRADALAHFFDLLPYLDEHGSPTWRATETAQRVFHLPEGIREHGHSSDKLLTWLRGQKAADFRFDPVLRRFVLINPNSI